MTLKISFGQQFPLVSPFLSFAREVISYKVRMIESSRSIIDAIPSIFLQIRRKLY